MGIPTNQILAPSQYLLQTFDLLDLHLVKKKLTKITDNLKDYRSVSFKKNLLEHITQQTAGQVNSVDFTIHKSMQNSFKAIAASFGVNGRYGVYSGSVKASMNLQEYRKSTAFNSSCIGTVNTGTTYLKNTHFTAANLSDYFDSGFIDALQGINTYADAQSFVNQYGTHIALGWNLGGSFSIQISAASSSYADKLKVQASAEAAYRNINSISDSASAAYRLNTNGNQLTFKQQTFTAGGDATKGAAIDIKTPGAKIKPWLDSCTQETTYGLSKSLPISELAKQVGYTSAGNILQQYIDLTILKYSLENPTIFSNHTAMQQNGTVNVTAIADKNYKIVSGGAAISNTINAQSFLTGSYPRTQSQDNGLLQITGWEATSGGASGNTSNYLTSYAVAVYDPGNHLDVFVSSTGGTNPGPGGDTANSPSWPDVNAAILTGGGCKTSLPSGGNTKYITSSGPKQLNGQWKSWQATVQDYVSPATEVNLIGYAIGIGCANFTITHTVTPQSTGSTQEHANQQVQLNDRANLIGGGVILGATTGGNGNLLRQSFPSSTDTWTEYNTDWASSNSPCIATAYVIGVAATINGVN